MSTYDDTGCLCGHDATDHARTWARCRAASSYGTPCECPRWVPDTSCPEPEEWETDDDL